MIKIKDYGKEVFLPLRNVSMKLDRAGHGHLSYLLTHITDFISLYLDSSHIDWMTKMNEKILFFVGLFGLLVASYYFGYLLGFGLAMFRSSYIVEKMKEE